MTRAKLARALWCAQVIEWNDTAVVDFRTRNLGHRKDLRGVASHDIILELYLLEQCTESNNPDLMFTLEELLQAEAEDNVLMISSTRRLAFFRVKTTPIRL